MDILTTIIIGYVSVLGLFMGSFLNLVADRLIANKTILGRSQCDHCRKILSPLALIPVVSYVLGAARSLCCKKHLSWTYPASELTTAVAYGSGWYFAPVSTTLEHIIELIDQNIEK